MFQYDSYQGEQESVCEREGHSCDGSVNCHIIWNILDTVEGLWVLGYSGG